MFVVSSWVGLLYSEVFRRFFNFMTIWHNFLSRLLYTALWGEDNSGILAGAVAVWRSYHHWPLVFCGTRFCEGVVPMRATKMFCLFSLVVVTLASVGCKDQAMLDKMKGEQVEIENKLSEATEAASKLLTENETLKSGVEAAKAAVAQFEEAAGQAKAAAEEALASAKKSASDALAAAKADAEAKIADAGAVAKKALDAANAKVAEGQKQLEAANAKVAELTAALKKAQEPAEEEEES